MVDRRSFLRSLIAGGATLAVTPRELLSSPKRTASTYFGVASFVDAHPDAVFIMRTSVDAKTNSTAVREAGSTFASSLFVPKESPGIPLTHRIAIKPNIVMMPVKEEQYMGIVTDPFFVEGVIQSLKLLGIGGDQFYLREVNDPNHFANAGYADMASRTGADLRKLDDPIGTIAESDLQWIDVPQGRWFKRIPFLWPVNAPDTWLLNIAKFKTHLMGMSLCAKNLQGAIAMPYVQHCAKYNSVWNIDSEDVQPDAKARIWDDYQRHLAAGIPRWDRPGEEGGIWQEIWAARCLDNNSVTPCGLHVIEGIYGREGPFLDGPGPNGRGVDHLTNVIIFGKNPFHVDNIGLWLGGHEPGNFGLLHLAVERGQASILDPHEIPLYEWFPDGTALSRTLDNFTRASLHTQYLRRDYDGQVEDDWHLVNEPYSYKKTLDLQVAVTSNWNLVSVPVEAPDLTVSSLFPAATSGAFGFSSGYYSAAVLEIGKGYWLKFASPQLCSISGNQVTSRSIAVKAGWNIIGTLEADAVASEVTSNPPGIVTSAFFGYDLGYAPATTLQKGRGYWVKVTQDGFLTLPPGSAKLYPSLAMNEQSLMRVIIEDAVGHHATLYLRGESTPNLRGELPPVPPHGVFDARFAGGWYIHGPADAHELEIKSAEYPVTLRMKNLKGRRMTIRDRAGSTLVLASLDEGVPVVLRQDLGALVIEESAVPGSYELSQNFPNPFNPQTEIGFQIPEARHVRLTVYDARGAEVRILVDERRDAGRYTVRFDGSGLSSGTYFFRMEVGGFVQTRKMLLLK